MRLINFAKVLLGWLAAAVLSFNSMSTAYAQTPAPTAGIETAPPGDTTILLFVAALLVLIVVGGVFWQARVRK